MHKSSTGVRIWIACENSWVELSNQRGSLSEETFDFIHICSVEALFRIDFGNIKVLPETQQLLELASQEVVCRLPWPVIHLWALSSFFWPVSNKGTDFKFFIFPINSSDLREFRTELVERRREPRKLFCNGPFPPFTQSRNLARQGRSVHFLHNDIWTTDGILGV